MSFFSFEGRLSRTNFAKIYLSFVISGMLVIMYRLLEATPRYAILVSWSYLFLYLLLIPSIVKRLHDAEKSWKYLFLDISSTLIGYIPLITQSRLMLLTLFRVVLEICYLIKVFSAGTEGENKFGPPDTTGKDILSAPNVFSASVLIIGVILLVI